MATPEPTGAAWAVLDRQARFRLAGPLRRRSPRSPSTQRPEAAGRPPAEGIRGALEAVTVAEAERSLPERSTLPPAIPITPTRGTVARRAAARPVAASQ